ncbi:MAG: MiaB/RimO family radical SAM methylthiotransferase [Microgenomates group bacterium]
MTKRYFIHTFGCQQNVADSERIATYCESAGMKKAATIEEANYVVITTCMIKESAENRVYGMVNNLIPLKEKKLTKGEEFIIVITGCMTGMAHRDKSGKMIKELRRRMPAADQFIPLEEIGFELAPLRQDSLTALIPISNGCNNFCTYCVVPYTRGREVSRAFENIVAEAQTAFANGFKKIQLLGQNVNSYGSDIVLAGKKQQELKPVYVKHLGKHRIPTLFPHLLEAVANIGFDEVSFMSSNPWDFSEELIDTIAQHKNITRTFHLAVQSGDDAVLKRMNRWYTAQEYIDLYNAIKKKMPEAHVTTDIIVGFCGETEEEFQNTVKLCETIHFDRAFISIYSNRRGTHAYKYIPDDIPHAVKDKRWKMLDKMVNGQFYKSKKK